MLTYFLTGLPVIVACLVLQAFVVSISLRYYARFRARHEESTLWDMLLLTAIMLLTLFGNCIQVGIWAALFMFLGEFDDFSKAVYHSWVNYVTLGYGDVVMSERWRPLGPLEAANGILMFGVSTSVMTAAVFDVIKTKRRQHEAAAARLAVKD
jgi:hypothetical protein